MRKLQHMTIAVTMLRLKLSLVLVLLYVVCGLCEKAWWQKAVIYQIYPRSFKDSNGDGIGDLNGNYLLTIENYLFFTICKFVGITESLWHVKDAGIDTIWLSPIYKSPMYDFGYDIADFKDIQPEYGTLKDFDKLVSESKKLGKYKLKI